MQYIGVLQEKGDLSTVESVRDEFVMRGHPLEPPAPAPKPAPPRPPTMERALPTPDEVADELSFDLDSGAPEFSIPAGEEEPQFSFDVPEPEPSFETPSFEMPSVETPPVELPAFEMPSFEPEPDLQAPSPLEELSFDAPVEEPVFEPASFDNAPSAEELRELDFYIEQELFDEAREKLAALSFSFPGDPSVDERRARFEAASVPAAKPSADAYAPPVLSRAEIESELLFALPDDDEDFLMPAPPPPPPPPPRAAAPPPVTHVHEENLFADEDDFFDLAAELESELEEESEEVSLSEEEQSLEEIFKEFKKGVEQQLDSEDYDTHYNLGIAYKEMGLIDEAIGEFQLASKDPKRAVECASMLGLCFLEKGMPQLAIKWYRKGLEMPEITPEEHVGLLYDLGSAFLEVGDTDNAQKAFVEVYGLNSHYRDIVTRIKQLEDARR